MPLDFDRLTRRVADTAARMKAFGYLNSSGPETPDRKTAYEVRFQPDPVHSLWNDKRLGFSQRFASLADLETFLDVVDRSIEAESAGIRANDAGALQRVLTRAVEFRRHA